MQKVRAAGLRRRLRDVKRARSMSAEPAHMHSAEAAHTHPAKAGQAHPAEAGRTHRSRTEVAIFTSSRETIAAFLAHPGRGAVRGAGIRSLSGLTRLRRAGLGRTGRAR